MKSRARRQNLLNLSLTFFFILVMNSFVITASFFLFFHSIDLTEAQIRQAAPVTFLNIIFLSLLFLAVHLVHSHITVTRPVRRIQKGLEQITDGDLSVRLAPESTNAAFDQIIGSINRMTTELSSVQTLQTDFVSNVSHEIKTPIAIIRNYSTLLQSDQLSDEDRIEYAKAVSDASERLSTLVTNILKLNRLEHQQREGEAETFDLSAQVTECLLSFEPVWEEKNIDIDPKIEDSVKVTFDRELLTIVWNNLLSNAFKFTEPGGCVGVVVKSEGDLVSVSVSDTGCGISPETGRHIFDKFYQGDTSHATQGNGLGLALVKRIIDLTGGEINVSSVPGEGSCFTVKLRKAK